MIRKYRFGNPLNTEAVVEEFPVEKGDIPRVEVKEGENLVEIRSSARKWMKTDTMFVSLLALERQMIRRGGLVLHCSFLDAGGSALLFSGPSGIGKTTQAQLWVREKGARIINGDRALLLPGAHGWTAYTQPTLRKTLRP